MTEYYGREYYCWQCKTYFMFYQSEDHDVPLTKDHPHWGHDAYDNSFGDFEFRRLRA